MSHPLPTTPAPAVLDHLVVMCRSLGDGVAWCEATLGVTPGPGGEHPLMGTHNRLLRLDTEDGQVAYLELIAINLEATPSIPTRASFTAGPPQGETAPSGGSDPRSGGAWGPRRWFDMDDLALRSRIEQHGPTLVHWVARVPDANASVAAMATLGIDRGAVLQASRRTDQGLLLQWHISVRNDGQRLFDGCLPTLIQWGSVHPSDAMPASGVRLIGLSLEHPQATLLNQALRSIGLATPAATLGPARLGARLQTPNGVIDIHT